MSRTVVLHLPVRRQREIVQNSITVALRLVLVSLSLVERETCCNVEAELSKSASNVGSRDNSFVVCVKLLR